MKSHVCMICTLALFFIFTPVIHSEDLPTIVIFKGVPFVKDMSDIEGTEQVKLSERDQRMYSVEIVKNGDRYFWASRQNRELFYSKSTGFHNFIEPFCAGYLRIVVTEKGIIYMEHLTTALKNITYWGAATECDLKNLE